MDHREFLIIDPFQFVRILLVGSPQLVSASVSGGHAAAIATPAGTFRVLPMEVEVRSGRVFARIASNQEKSKLPKVR
jgi:hypothetical protein